MGNRNLILTTFSKLVICCKKVEYLFVSHNLKIIVSCLLTLLESAIARTVVSDSTHLLSYSSVDRMSGMWLGSQQVMRLNFHLIFRLLFQAYYSYWQNSFVCVWGTESLFCVLVDSQRPLSASRCPYILS